MSSPLINTATWLANKMGKAIIAEASEKAPTRKIGPHIKYEVIGTEEVRLEIGVDISKGAAPMARAFEYGSGLNATRATPSKNQEGSGGYIIIRPVNYPYLNFIGTHEWAGKVIHVPPMGGGVVHHPGVKAHPYLKLSIDNVRRRFYRDMKLGLLEAAKAHIKLVFDSFDEPIG